MKRFGILFLLSASYAGLLTLIFSTDYSRENSFLLAPPTPEATAKAFQSPVMADYAMISERIETFDDLSKLQIADNAKRTPSEQSPEGAGEN